MHFAPGETETTVTVPLEPDTLDEDDESSTLGGIMMQHTAIDTKIVNNIAALAVNARDELQERLSRIMYFYDNLVASPLFLDIALQDNRLLPESPALEKGLTGWAPLENVEDLPRTIPPSIGAY